MNEIGKKNVVQDKSFGFALDIIKLYKKLVSDKKEFVLSKQILRSGTSIGANIREAQNAESKIDFIHKLGIAQKENDETLYWLELLHGGGYIDSSEYDKYQTQALELLKIIRSIIISSKKNLKK